MTNLKMSKKIILDGAVVADHWLHLADDAAIPETGDTIVSLTRWQAERDALLNHNGKLAVVVESDTVLADIADDLTHFAMIALHFPEFKDGRCYSHARLLRERHQYTGELRAIGDVLRDQLFYLVRCGINALEIRADRDIDDALNAFNDFTVKYQPACDEPEPLYRRRAA